MNNLTSIAVVLGIALHIVYIINVSQTARLYFKFRPEFKKRNPKRVFTNIFVGSADINELAYEDQLKQGFTKIPLFTRADHIDLSSNIVGGYLFIAVLIPLLAIVPAVLADKRTPSEGLLLWAALSLMVMWAQLAITLTIIFRRWLARRTGTLWQPFELITYSSYTSPVDDKVIESFKLKTSKDNFLVYIFYLLQVTVALAIASPIVGIVLVLFKQA